MNPNRFITSVFRSTDPEDRKHYIKVIDTQGVDFCFFIAENMTLAGPIHPSRFPESRKLQGKKTLHPKVKDLIIGMLEKVEFETNLQ